MKKIISFFAMIAVSATAVFAQGPLIATITTSEATNNNYYFSFLADVEGATFHIDWGTGTPVITDAVTADGTYGATDIASAFETTGSESVIKIYGTGLKSFYVSNKKIKSVVFEDAAAANLIEFATPNNQLGNYDFSKFTNLTTLDFGTNGATELDLSVCTKLAKATLSANKFTSLTLPTSITNILLVNTGMTSYDFSPLTNLKDVTISTNEWDAATIASLPSNLNSLVAVSCKFTSFDPTRFTELTTLNLNSNTLSTIDVSKNTKLATIMLATTGVSGTLDLSNALNIKTITINGTAASPNKLTSVLLPAAGGTNTSIAFNAAYNQLSDIDFSGLNPVQSMNIRNNKFTFATIPNKTSLMTTAARYTYAPQDAMEISDIVAGEVVDFSAHDNLLGNTATADPQETQTTTFAWAKEDGTALVVGTDYTVTEAGKFTFASSLLGEKVVCTMSSAAFPNFTGTNAFKTTAATIVSSTGITNTTAADFTVVSVEGGIVVSNIDTNSAISVFSITGSQVANTVASGTTLIALPQGAYIVRVNNKAVKALVK